MSSSERLVHDVLFSVDSSVEIRASSHDDASVPNASSVSTREKRDSSDPERVMYRVSRREVIHENVFTRSERSVRLPESVDTESERFIRE